MKQQIKATVLFFILFPFITPTVKAQWSLTGNAGTNGSTNFIGTTDNVAFKIRTKNAVRITVNGAGKVGIGTTSPIFKLDVKGGSINTDSVYRIGGNTVLSVKGFGNSFTGIYSGYYNSTGTWNTATGYAALYSNIDGIFNTAFGANALGYNIDGYENVANGTNALVNNTSGDQNVANGSGSLYYNTLGSFNTATGHKALYNNTTADFNTANGYLSLYHNTTGEKNLASGTYALEDNTTGYFNTASGYAALSNNTTGFTNTANGVSALYSNTTGSYNTAHGMYALYGNTNSSYNTASGYQSLYYSSSGQYNTANGMYALLYNVSGQYNTGIGYNTGANNGYNLTNSTALGYNAGHIDNATNEIEIGNSSVAWIAGQVGWSNWSDRRIKDNIQSNVPGLSFITKLNPVTYNLNIHRQNEMCGIKDTNEWEGKYDIEKITQTGFLAQEVEQAARENNFDFNGVRAPAGNVKLYSLQYAAFVVPLVKAVQELSRLNDDLKAEVSFQKSEIEMIKSVLSSEQKQKLDEIKKGNVSMLEQNSPNPFNTQTEIKFRLPATFSSAQLIITDADGRQVRNDELKYSSSIIINAGEISAGTYTYTLFVDGSKLDSKQMILTR